MSDDPPRDRLEFWVRFVCGAMLGALLALMLIWRALSRTEFAWLVIPAAALLLGFAAARWGDGFWHFLLGLFRWW